MFVAKVCESVTKETSDVADKHVYEICLSEFLHFRGCCASIFVIFFYSGLKFHVDFISFN